jgi:hypothetical protein
MRCVAEMMKAGLIEEMMDDVMDGVNETEEEEVDEEVAKVLQEVAGEEIAKLPDAGRVQVEPEKTEEVCWLCMRSAQDSPCYLASYRPCQPLPARSLPTHCTDMQEKAHELEMLQALAAGKVPEAQAS